ncbi:hypothetical protein BAY61_20800 [Prauserella marina]|uniref:Uncharacterized protein n=1 Tax=Prauserella marina TaxID=530584 RepID=A0A222VSV9_9PSEU|nr:hypothetical protein [Prauserella marina]ASR37016.1 hypothetical protein BAY61_20800 [Prauserella marina]PWV80009.1 hypothetical protein DES30_10395 [Prauserella marina]SDD85154.1 hypothetical protein SAMN05421630_113122 [Prauserella marina]
MTTPDGTGPSKPPEVGEDTSNVKFDQAVYATTGLGPDIHVPVKNGGGEQGWFKSDGTVTAGSDQESDSQTGGDAYSYHAWEKWYISVYKDQTKVEAWTTALQELNDVVDQMKDGKAELMDVGKLRDAKAAVDHYVNWLNSNHETLQSWSQKLNSDDSAFKGKAAYAIRQNLVKFANTLDDVRTQIVEERATSQGLADIADALSRFAKGMNDAWHQYHAGLKSVLQDTMSAVIENVRRYIRGMGLVHGTPNYALDILSNKHTREPAEAYIEETVKNYSSSVSSAPVFTERLFMGLQIGADVTGTNTFAPGPLPSGFPEISGPLDSPATWGTINKNITDFVLGKIKPLDTRAAELMTELDTAYQRSKKPLEDIVAPTTLPPPGGGGNNGLGGDNPFGDDNGFDEDDIRDLFGGGDDGDDNGGGGDDNGGLNEDDIRDLFGGGDDGDNNGAGGNDGGGGNDNPFGDNNGTGGDNPFGTGGDNSFGGGGNDNPFGSDNPFGTGGDNSFGGDPFGTGGDNSLGGNNSFGSDNPFGNGSDNSFGNGPVIPPGGFPPPGGFGGSNGNTNRLGNQAPPAGSDGNAFNGDGFGNNWPDFPGQQDNEQDLRDLFSNLPGDNNQNQPGDNNQNLPGDNFPVDDRNLPEIPEFGSGDSNSTGGLDTPNFEDLPGSGASNAAGGSPGFSGGTGSDFPGGNNGSADFGGSGNAGNTFGGEGWSDWSGQDQGGGGGNNTAFNPGEQNGRGMPMMPPMMPPTGGNQGDSKERERQTWLSEDDKIWGTEAMAGNGIVGLPGDTANETDEPLAPTHVHVGAGVQRGKSLDPQPEKEQARQAEQTANG